MGRWEQRAVPAGSSSPPRAEELSGESDMARPPGTTTGPCKAHLNFGSLLPGGERADRDPINAAPGASRDATFLKSFSATAPHGALGLPPIRGNFPRPQPAPTSIDGPETTHS